MLLMLCITGFHDNKKGHVTLALCVCVTGFPAGTGKTLMARQIGTMLHAREPKIVNGPGMYM